jgi:predicted nucleic acid-binding protein
VIVVADASPLIALARIGQLRLLPSIYDFVHIPSAVHLEIIRRPPGFAEGLPHWLRVTEVADAKAAAGLQPDLDPGEAAAIVLASELSLPLLIDDGAGRLVAQSRGLSMIGTLIDQLRAARFRMSQALVAQILRAAGEA